MWGCCVDRKARRPEPGPGESPWAAPQDLGLSWTPATEAGPRLSPAAWPHPAPEGSSRLHRLAAMLLGLNKARPSHSNLLGCTLDRGWKYGRLGLQGTGFLGGPRPRPCTDMTSFGANPPEPSHVPALDKRLARGESRARPWSDSVPEGREGPQQRLCGAGRGRAGSGQRGWAPHVGAQKLGPLPAGCVTSGKLQTVSVLWCLVSRA